MFLPDNDNSSLIGGVFYESANIGKWVYHRKFAYQLSASRFHALRLCQLCQLFRHHGFHVSRSSKAITQAQRLHPGRVIKLIVCYRHDKLRDTGVHCLRTSADAPTW